MKAKPRTPGHRPPRPFPAPTVSYSAAGIKHDTGKARWSLLPAGTVAAILAVLEAGAIKYSVDNWQRVDNPRQRYYDALMRHVEAWWSGERRDAETGLHHLAHAGCCLLFLLWFEQNDPTKP